VVTDVINGRYRYLLENGNNTLGKVFVQFSTTQMRPVVLVDYWREPYIFRRGKDRIRVTIDTDIRSATSRIRFFDSFPCRHLVLDRNKAVLEIKYQKEIPVFLATAFNNLRALRTSFSKYALSRKVSKVASFDM
jgi:hypothetical protein